MSYTTQRVRKNDYKAVVRKARAQTRARSIAAAKEKDPFWRALKKPIVSNEDILQLFLTQ